MSNKTDRGLYKRRGSPHWWIRYADRNGHMVRQSTGTTEKKLARDILAKKKVQVAENRHLDVKKMPKIMFPKLCNLYWDKKGQYLKMKGLKSMIRIWKDYFGNVKTGEITQSRVENFLVAHIETETETRRKLTEATRNRHVAQLKALFNWALERSDELVRKNLPPLAAHNPLEKIKRTSEDHRRRTRYLDTDEIDRLIKACVDKKGKPKKILPLIVTALHTGMRRGELFNLRWKDLDFKTRLITVRNSKSGKPREIPMDQFLFDTLKDLPSRFHKDFVFPSPKTGVKLTDIKKQFATVVKEAGVKGISLHTLRHTFASHLVMNGVDLKTVAELLGHSSTRMTERYAHLSPDHKTRAVRILDSAYQTDTKTDTVHSDHNKPASEAGVNH